MNSFEPNKTSSQFIGNVINWTAHAEDSKKNTIFYSFYLRGPATNNTWVLVQDWSTQNWWIWNPSEPGDYTVEVKVTNSKINFNSGLYDSRETNYTIMDWAVPVNADDWYHQGLALENLGRYQEASKAYDEAINLNPNITEYWNSNSKVCYYLGDFNKTLKCASMVTELDPSE